MKLNYWQLITRFPRHIGFGSIHYFYSSLGQSFLVSIFVPYLNTAFEIDNNKFAFYYAIATLSSAFLLPFIGKWIDKVRIRYMSLLNAAALAGFAYMLSEAQNIYVLIVSLLGLRLCGQGLMILIGSTGVARFFDNNRGKALSLSALGLSVGETLLPLIVTYLVSQFEWQITWKILSCSIFLVHMPLAIGLISKKDSFQLAALPKKDAQGVVQEQKGLSRRQVLKDFSFYLIIPNFIFLPFLFTGMFMHQNLIAGFKDWSLEFMTASFSMYGLTKFVNLFVTGSMIDRFSSRKIFVFNLVPIFLSLLLLYFSDHRFAALFYFFSAGLSTSLGSLTSMALWAELYGYKHLGAIKSMVTTFVIFSTALGPVVLGKLFETKVVMEQTFLVLALVVVGISVLSYVGISRKKMAES